MKDFSSAAFVGLIARQMAAAGIAAPQGTPPGGPPTVPIDVKRALLAQALSEGGPGFLLRIGQGIHEVRSDPTLDVLRGAGDPQDLLQRWQRLEKYHHSRHRTRLVDAGRGSIRLHHAALAGEPPGAAEDLVVLGLLVALLQAIGCRGMTVGLEGEGRTVAVMRQDRFLAISESGPPTAEWSLRWAEVRSAEAPRFALQRGANAVEQLYALLEGDPLKVWPLATAARVMGYSARSLQRLLRGHGASYSGILRDVRVRHAAKAMLNSGAGLAEIGYASGFSDQAHFTREFRRVIGASPAEWRRISAG